MRTNVLSPFILNNHFHDVNWFILFFVFVAGVSAGSFSHALSVRILNNKSLLYGRSKCDYCSKKLFWWQLIPILSYFILKGRCYFCRKPINFQLFIFEIFLGTIFVLYFIYFDYNAAISFSILSIFLLSILNTDYEGMIIHLPTVILVIIFGVIFNVAFFGLNTRTILNISISFSIGWSFIFLISSLYFVIRGNHGFGSGDKWLLGSIAVWFGYIDTIYIFFYSCIFGSLFGLLSISNKKSFLNAKIPIGSLFCLFGILYPFL